MRSLIGGAVFGKWARGTWFRGLAACAVVAAIGGGWGSIVTARQDQPSPDDPAEPIVRQELKIALDAYDTFLKMRQIGAPVNLSVTQAYTWSRRGLEAQLYLSLGREEKTEDAEVYLTMAKGAPNAERIRFFEEHLRRMTYVEGQNKILLDRAQISELDFSNVVFYRRQAEVWLAREKGRRPASK